MKEAVKLGMEISLLIVEDEKKFAALLQSIFGNHPDISHVETVHDAETAAEKLKESTYGVVLTDFRLPGADGFELMCSQDGSEKAPSFVVMTSFDTDEALLESYSLGAMGYVPKTAGPEAFVTSVVNAAVGKKTIENEVGADSCEQCWLTESASYSKDGSTIKSRRSEGSTAARRGALELRNCATAPLRGIND